MKQWMYPAFACVIALALTALGCGGSEEPVDNIGNAFTAVDQDNNGAISMTEWNSSGLPEATFSENDMDGDGTLNDEEFATAVGGNAGAETNTEFAASETPTETGGEASTETGSESVVSTETGGESGDESGGESSAETSSEQGGEACTASCENLACGDDGCGGVCGVCAPGTSCTEAGQCECMPSCTGVECGDDGCGGSCGSCDGTGTCLEGHCVQGCITAGTGTQIGDIAKNITWTTSTNDSVDLHSFCAVKKAVVVIETAAW
jgi:hypothetical protein